VTEGVTGVNLPACQVLIGCGVPLQRIPAIRALFGQEPRGSEPFDPEVTPKRPADGHVMAVRVTAEDAGDGFKPTAGRIEELTFRPTPDVWGYFSVKSGGAIHQFSDSQFGHVFARGPSREAALAAMVAALKDLTVSPQDEAPGAAGRAAARPRAPSLQAGAARATACLTVHAGAPVRTGAAAYGARPDPRMRAPLA
jgi:biotin carboxylase